MSIYVQKERKESCAVHEGSQAGSLSESKTVKHMGKTEYLCFWVRQRSLRYNTDGECRPPGKILLNQMSSILETMFFKTYAKRVEREATVWGKSLKVS